MKLIQNKCGKWAVYDDNGKIVIITIEKTIAINYARLLSSELEA